MDHTNSHLPVSVAQKRLADLISEIRFGVIRNLRVENGQPVFSPAPKIVRNIKFGVKDTSKTRPDGPKLHKEQMAQLFSAIADIGDGSIESLEIQSGLPFKLNVSYDYRF